MPRKPRKPAPNGKVAKQAGKRLARAAEKRRDVVSAGEVYEPYIYGEAPTVLGKPGTAGYEKAAAKVAEQEQALGKNWRKTSVPKFSEIRRLTKALLVANTPDWENEEPRLPPNPTDTQRADAELRRRQRRLYEELAGVIYREFEAHQSVGMAVDDAMQFGRGAFVTDWNGDIDQPLCGFKYVSIKRVLVDTETCDDPLGQGQRWRAIGYEMPEGDAKKLAADVWDNPGYEFKSAANELSADEDGNIHAEELPTRFVRIVMVYVHGDSPHLREARMDAEDGEEIEDVGDDDVYNGRDHILVMECQGEWDDPTGYALIARTDPIYPNDLGCDPVTLFTLEPTNRDFWSPPLYQKGHSLQVSLNWAMRYMNTDAYFSAKRAIGVVKGAFDKTEQEKLVARTENLPVVEASDQGKLQNGYRVLDFGQPNGVLDKVVGVNSSIFEEIMGMDMLASPGKSHESSARAQQSQMRAQLLTDSMADQVDAGVTEAMRKALMACRKKLTAEQVAAWVGSEYLYFEPRIDESTGETVQYSPLWNDEVNDIKSIRMEVDIRIKPRSMRYASREAQLAGIDRLSGNMNQMIDRIGQVNQVNPELAQDMARAGNVVLRYYGELLDLPYAQEMTIDLRKAIIPATPQPGQMPGPGSEMPDMGEMPPGMGGF